MFYTSHVYQKSLSGIMLSIGFRKTFLPFTTWLNWLIEIKFPEIHCNHPTKFTEMTNLLKSHDLSTSLDQGGLHNFIFFFLQLGNSWISIICKYQLFYTSHVYHKSLSGHMLSNNFRKTFLPFTTWLNWLIEIKFPEIHCSLQLDLQK